MKIVDFKNYFALIKTPGKKINKILIKFKLRQFLDQSFINKSKSPILINS